MNNNHPQLTQGLLDAIAMYMDDDIRDELHSAADWQHPGEFLTAYMAADPDFPLDQFLDGIPAHNLVAFRAWAERVARDGVSIDVMVSEYLMDDPEHYELSGQFTRSGRPEVYPA